MSQLAMFQVRRITSMDDSALAETSGAVNEAGDEATILSTSGPTGDFERDAALQLIIATFPNSEAALAAFRGVDGIKWAERAEQILLIDAAVVHRDEGNKLHVEDEQDWPGHMGALQGAGIGTILGMVAGPLGMVVGG